MTAQFRITNDVDFIAMAPVTLGFPPKHSLVMMSIESFHARVDLPSPEDYDAVINALLAPSKKHAVKRVAFLVFDDAEHIELIDELVRQFTDADIEVLTALSVRGNEYKRFRGDWMTFDLTGHPLVLEAQFNDLSPRHTSRDDLADYIRPHQEKLDDKHQAMLFKVRSEGIAATVMNLSRENGREAADDWCHVLRGCIPGTKHASDVALILAFQAWLSGDGALAWVALDFGNRNSPWYSTMYAILDEAISPKDWDQFIASM